MEEEVERLRNEARNEFHFTARDAIEKLAEIGDQSLETLELLVDLAASPPGITSEAAFAAIQELGQKAIAALIERAGSPSRPGDETLLARYGRSLGPELLPLCRILIVDGDLSRASAADEVVIQFIDELAIDDVIDIYVAVCDRERDIAPSVPAIMSAMWQRFATEEGREAVRARWLAHDLWPWIEERLGGRSVVACMLLALLAAGPDEADTTIREVVTSAVDRPLAIQSMLWVDPLRLGRILRADLELSRWAEREFVRQFDRIESRPNAHHHRLMIVMGHSPVVVRALLCRPRLSVDRLVELVRTFRPPGLLQALQAVEVPAFQQPAVAALIDVLEAP